MKTIYNIIGIVGFSTLAWGHARLTSPTPRNNNAGIKAGPCGGLARSATPMQVQGGQALTVQWEETINHPGRFIFSLSLAGDTGFQQNVLATVPDQQDQRNDLPHRYQTTVMIPNINCSTCTLQMIQSMEENPAAPSYYYSCADLMITQTGAPPVPTPTPTPQPMPPANGGEGTLSSTMPGNSGVSFGKGCGTVKSVATEVDPHAWMALLTLLFPVLTWLGIRKYYFSATM